MKGLIFMPDISGFTNFVKSIDSDLGASITRDLLNEIIDRNSLNLDLSEIEGDAVLFYKIGKPIPLQNILTGFKNMYEAFDTKYRHWKLQYRIQADLSLKLIVHYGNITVYNIKGFTKLYGETVIESHRLLKNESGASDYMLVTEDYMKALQEDITQVLTLHSAYVPYKAQSSTGVRKIAYYFFPTIKRASAISEFMVLKQPALQNDMYLAMGTSGS